MQSEMAKTKSGTSQVARMDNAIRRKNSAFSYAKLRYLINEYLRITKFKVLRLGEY